MACTSGSDSANESPVKSSVCVGIIIISQTENVRVLSRALGQPVPAVVTVLMEVLSSPLFALVHNTFPNRERKGPVKGPWTACTSGSGSADGSPVKSSVCLGNLDTKYFHKQRK